MLQLIGYRLLQGVIVLLIVSLAIFALLAAAGGDALTALGNDPRVSEATLAALRRTYGLDQPLLVRYWHWLLDALRGQFGHSFYFQVPVASIIKPRLWHTLALTITALLMAWTVALALGLAAARRAGGWLDRACELFVLLGSSTPRLVLALLLLAWTAQSAWFEVGGATADLSWVAWLGRLLPSALVLSVPLAALFLAQTRASVGAMLNEDFVRVARAKGLTERAVLWRHALRPALNPLLTVGGYSLGSLLSGSVVVEKILGWPGLCSLSVTAVQSRDVPLLLGVVLVTATAVLLSNLLADILLRLNDPRLR
jgi:peptide/nickel transport system permease protein